MSYVADSSTADGDFTRDSAYIDTRITADGRDGYPVEPGRYRLVVARACPWANRTIIVRRLLGLEDALSIAFCGPTHDERSWTFDLDPGGVDPVLGIHYLRDAYNKRVPDYPKGVTVPAIVDVPTGQVVTNDFARITLDFSTEWTAHHRDGAPQLYPERWRDEINEVAQRVYTEINNGVYRCGFAGTQKAYEKAYDRTPGFGDTTDFVQIKQHYYIVHTDINPTRVVPKGPDLANWLTPHGREALGGRPFGDGSPPGPPREDERVPAAHSAG